MFIEATLIIGSGMRYHNMRRFRSDSAAIDPQSVHFDAWLTETVAQAPIQPQPCLQNWTAAPGVRAAHSREESLLPLHVVAAAGGDNEGRQVFQDRVLGSMQSAFTFGG